MTVTDIELPTHCPICHKPIQEKLEFVAMDGEGSVSCLHCWHLDQELSLQTMRVLPDWLCSLRRGINWVMGWRDNMKPSVREQRRRLQETIEEIHSGEVPVVTVTETEPVEELVG